MNRTEIKRLIRQELDTREQERQIRFWRLVNSIGGKLLVFAIMVGITALAAGYIISVLKSGGGT